MYIMMNNIMVKKKRDRDLEVEEEVNQKILRAQIVLMMMIMKKKLKC